MRVEVTMPQLSDTMNDGRILSWLKRVGDTVSRGDTLAEVATDKADLEIESFHEGTLVEITAAEGSTVKVGSVIAHIDTAHVDADKGQTVVAETEAAQTEAAQTEAAEDSEFARAELAQVGSEVSQTQLSHTHASDSSVNQSQRQVAQSNKLQPQHDLHSNFSQPNPGSTPTVAADNSAERVKISPLAKNYAEAHGVNVNQLSGSGENGRIVKKDVESALGVVSGGEKSPAERSTLPLARSEVSKEPVTREAPRQALSNSPQPPPPSGGRSVTPLSRMRQAIADRMVESVTTIPHFYVTIKIRASKLSALRELLKPLPQYEGITINHLILKACGLALREVPRVNAAYDGGNLVEFQSVNIGIVTAVPDGLLIPVVKSVDTVPLADIVGESRALVHRARAGRPKADDLVGGTFTISNLGMFDIESFTAVINPGQGAILAVSTTSDEPVVEDGQVVPGQLMRLTLSVDHRIIDGAVAGQFLKEVKRLLEEPVLLIA